MAKTPRKPLLWEKTKTNKQPKNEEIPFQLHNFAATKFINSADQHRKINFLMTVFK